MHERLHARLPPAHACLHVHARPPSLARCATQHRTTCAPSPQAAKECNDALLNLRPGDEGGRRVSTGTVLDVISRELRSEQEPTRLEALRWVHFLLVRCGGPAARAAGQRAVLRSLAPARHVAGAAARTCPRTAYACPLPPPSQPHPAAPPLQPPPLTVGCPGTRPRCLGSSRRCWRRYWTPSAHPASA